jgi:hypothetical protein
MSLLVPNPYAFQCVSTFTVLIPVIGGNLRCDNPRYLARVWWGKEPCPRSARVGEMTQRLHRLDHNCFLPHALR